MTNFKKGDKVICISDSNMNKTKEINGGVFTSANNKPVKGSVYTIRDISPAGGFLLGEIFNKPTNLSDGSFGETSFAKWRFALYNKEIVEKSVVEFDINYN